MSDAVDRLLTLRVTDVMAKGVVVLRDDQSLAEAAAVFAEHDVTSAPVVDSSGKCVGMLSAADFARQWPALDSAGGQEKQDGPCDGEGATQNVGSCMTRDVSAVDPDQSLLSAARTMCISHLHRLPVFREGSPVGVISTMDVVAALVNSVDEMTHSGALGPPDEPASD